MDLNSLTGPGYSTHHPAALPELPCRTRLGGSTVPSMILMPWFGLLLRTKVRKPSTTPNSSLLVCWLNPQANVGPSNKPCGAPGSASCTCCGLPSSGELMTQTNKNTAFDLLACLFVSDCIAQASTPLSKACSSSRHGMSSRYVPMS